MANQKVSVYKYVKVGGSWKRCPPYINPKNNKPENDKVLVNGVMEVHPEGDWGLWWYEGGKRKWKAIGPKYAPAKYAAEVKELALRSRAKGLVVAEKTDGTPLRASLQAFLDDKLASRKLKTYQILKYDLEEFVTWVRKDSLEDITRTDLLRYKQYIMTSPEKPRTVKPHTVIKLRSERTACNKVGEVNQFLRWAMKVEAGKGLITMRDIKTVNKRVEVYSEEELKRFFAACKPLHHLIFTVFLQSGFRKQELAHLEWADVDYDHNILRVTAKERAGYKFEPKTYEERDVTVPRSLMDRLREHQQTANKKHMLVFGTRSGNPNDKIWDLCVGVGKKAGVPDAFVHKFRATFATTCLQRGMDLKTLQEQLGHKDIKSTMRYLAGLPTAAKRQKVESIWGGQEVSRGRFVDDLDELLAAD